MAFSNRMELDINGNRAEFLMYVEDSEQYSILKKVISYADRQYFVDVKIPKKTYNSKGEHHQSEMFETLCDMVTDLSEETAVQYCKYIIDKARRETE